MLGLVLGTLRLPFVILVSGGPLAAAGNGGWLGARATGRISENSLRLSLGLALLVVGLAFAVEAAR